MDMSEILGEVFGTMPKTASAHTEEDTASQAQIEYFTNLCKEAGIDPEKLTDDQLTELFAKSNAELAKHAGEMPPFMKKKEEGKEEEKGEGKKHEEEEAKAKEAAALQEFAEKRAAQAKIDEAIMIGQIMAHSCVAEMNKVAAALQKKAAEDEEKGKNPFPPKKEEKKEEEKEASAKERLSSLLLKKTASSSTPRFDEFAAYRAIELLKEAGVDPELAFNRVNAVYTLGLSESAKLASVEDPMVARDIRALEICEHAGFEVDWAQK